MTETTPTAATPEELAARDFYQKPEHGWTCFHCGETFTTLGTARDHFGFDPSAEPGCRIKVGAERGLLMALRKAEKECADAWFAIHNETTDAAKAYYAASARHQEQLRTAEEAGYERGIRDAQEAIATAEAALTASLERERVMREALRKCISPFSGYAIQSDSQAVDVMKGFFAHIREVDAIARAALQPKEPANG